jgi:hypothetical protein
VAAINTCDPRIVDTSDPRYGEVPSSHDLMLSLMCDSRAAGIRAALFGLRGTNEIVAQDVQAHLHALGVLKASSLAEIRNVFTGQSIDFAPEDAPWPGCVQMRRDSSDQIAPYHVWRIKPSQLGAAARAVADIQPDMDELSLLAMNGRDPSGEPFEDLFSGELDCFDTRWSRYFAKHGIKRDVLVGVDSRDQVTDESAQPITSSQPTSIGLDDALADLDDAVKRAERRRLEARAERGDTDEPEPDERTDAIDEKTWFSIIDNFKESASTWQTHARMAIETAGSAGIGPKEIISAMTIHQVIVHRDTLHQWLNAELAAGRLTKPRFGRWAAVGDDPLTEDGDRP